MKASQLVIPTGDEAGVLPSLSLHSERPATPPDPRIVRHTPPSHSPPLLQTGGHSGSSIHFRTDTTTHEGMPHAASCSALVLPSVTLPTGGPPSIGAHAGMNHWQQANAFPATTTFSYKTVPYHNTTTTTTNTNNMMSDVAVHCSGGKSHLESKALSGVALGRRMPVAPDIDPITERGTVASATYFIPVSPEKYSEEVSPRSHNLREGRDTRGILEDLFFSATGCASITAFLELQQLGAALCRSLIHGACFTHEAVQPRVPPALWEWWEKHASTTKLCEVECIDETASNAESQFTQPPGGRLGSGTHSVRPNSGRSAQSREESWTRLASDRSMIASPLSAVFMQDFEKSSGSSSHTAGDLPSVALTVEDIVAEFQRESSMAKVVKEASRKEEAMEEEAMTIPMREDLPTLSRCDGAAIDALRFKVDHYFKQLRELVSLTTRYHGKWGLLNKQERMRLQEVVQAERRAHVTQKDICDCFEELDYSNENVRCISEDIRLCRHVKRLRMSNNPKLCSVPFLPPACQLFSACACSIDTIQATSKSIFILSLSHNKLQSMGFINGFPNLRVLDLSNNQLCSIQEAATCLRQHSAVIEVSLHGNPIALVDDYRRQIASACPQLERLDGRPIDAPERRNASNTLEFALHRLPVEAVDAPGAATPGVAGGQLSRRNSFKGGVSAPPSGRRGVGGRKGRGAAPPPVQEAPSWTPEELQDRREHLTSSVAAAVEILAVRGLSSLQHHPVQVGSEDDLRANAALVQSALRPFSEASVSAFKPTASPSPVQGKKGGGGGGKAPPKQGLYQCRSYLVIRGRWGDVLTIGQDFAEKEDLEAAHEAEEVEATRFDDANSPKPLIATPPPNKRGGARRTKESAASKPTAAEAVPSTTQSPRYIPKPAAMPYVKILLPDVPLQPDVPPPPGPGGKAGGSSSVAGGGGGNAAGPRGGRVGGPQIPTLIEDVLYPLLNGVFAADLALTEDLMERLRKPFELVVEVRDEMVFSDVSIQSFIENGGAAATGAGKSTGRMRKTSVSQAALLAMNAQTGGEGSGIAPDETVVRHVRLGTIAVDPTPILSLPSQEVQLGPLGVAVFAADGTALSVEDYEAIETAKRLAAGVKEPKARGASHERAGSSSSSSAKNRKGVAAAASAAVPLSPAEPVGVQRHVCLLGARLRQTEAHLIAERSQLQKMQAEMSRALKAYQAAVFDLEQLKLSEERAALAQQASASVLQQQGSGGGGRRAMSANTSSSPSSSNNTSNSIGGGKGSAGASAAANAKGGKVAVSAAQVQCQQEIDRRHLVLLHHGIRTLALQWRLQELSTASLTVDLKLRLGRGVAPRTAEQDAILQEMNGNPDLVNKAMGNRRGVVPNRR